MRAPPTLLLAAPLLLAPTGCAVERIDSIIDERGVTWCSTTETTTETGSSTSTGSSSSSSGAMDSPAAGSHDADPSSTATTEALTSSDSSSDTTTAAEPVCGDGVVDQGEDCDDMNTNDADACRNDCSREWYVFLTSFDGQDALQGDDIKGVIGADYQCRHRAAKLFLPNAERYMAWISTSDSQPVDRLHHARGPYKLVTGVRVAASWDALLAGPLEHPINVDELGQTVHYVAWTGTLPDGTRAPNSTHCDDWTDNDSDNFAVAGDADATDHTWTHGIVAHCGGEALLYCFEQP
jgi:cysteine-rich repeat protein